MAVVETDIPLWLLYVIGAEQARARSTEAPAAGAAPLAVDPSSPPSVYQDAGNTTTTASFSPPAGSLLVVWARYNTGSGNQPTDPSVTDSLGAHLTYTLRAHARNPEVSTSLNGAVAVWTAPITTAPGAMTVSVTETDAATGLAVLAQVWTHGSGQPTSGAVAESGDNTSGTTSVQAYTATANSSRGVMGWEDWNASGTPTAGTGCTTTGGDAANASLTMAFACVLRSVADGVNGASTTLTINHNSTSQRRWIALEVVPPSGATVVDVNAEATAHTVAAGDSTTAVAVPDTTAPVVSHTTGDATTALAGNAEQAITTHTTHDATTSITVPAGDAANTHTSNNPTFSLGEDAEHAIVTHQTGDATTSSTTPAGTAIVTHQAENVTATSTTPAGETVTTHQAFDPTVSTAVITNVNAEDTIHTLTAGDTIPTITVAAQDTITTHQTHQPTVTVAQSATDVTAPALDHQTHQPTTSVAQSTTDVVAPALTHQTHQPATTLAIQAQDTITTHQTFDPTVTTGVVVTAGDAATSHQTFDTTTRIDIPAGPASITHQTDDPTVTAPAGPVNVNPDTALNTHTTFNVGYGLTPSAQAAATTHQTLAVTSTQTTASEGATVGLTAFDAIVQVGALNQAHISIDTGLAWATNHDGTAVPSSHREGLATVGASLEPGPATASSTDGHSLTGPVVE